MKGGIMNTKRTKKSWQVVSFLVITAIVILACGSTPDPTATPQQVQPTKQEPIIIPTSTNTVEPFVFPTEEATQEITEEVTEEPVQDEEPAFFTEEWDDDNSAWSIYKEPNGGDANIEDIEIFTESGKLLFEMDRWLMGYVLYDPWYYEDVRLDVEVENRGANTFTVSIICRYSDEGYYVADISSGGLYTIYAYDAASEEFYSLANGGSTLIKQGKDINTYTWICEGRELTLGVNGTEVKTYTDNKYVFRDGFVGAGVTSYDVIPVKVEFEYISITEP